SGRCESAARAYTNASEVSWELTHYALLGAGRCWLQVDEPAQALAALGQVPLEGPVGNGLRPLLAEAAERTGDLERAGQLWSAEVSAAPSADAHRALARILLARLQARGVLDEMGRPREAGAVSEAEARAILVHARAAEVGLAPASDGARAARALQRSAAALLPEGEAALAGPREPEVELRHVEALHDTGHLDDALDASDALIQRLSDRWSPVGCKLSFVRGKVFARQRQWARASEELAPAVRQCR